MRVCDLTTLYIDGGEGGVNTYLLEKARYLQARPGAGHVMILPGARDERRELFGSTIYVLRSPQLPSNPHHRVLTRFHDVERILRDEAPSLVEVDCAYLLGKVATRALRAANVPVIGFYHVHLPTFIARPRASRFGSMFAGAAERATWRYVSYCNQACDRLVVTSQDMLRRLSRTGFEGRLDYVPLGVNLDLFRPRAEPAAPDAPREILYVGRLSREKEIHVLLDAFARLAPAERWRLRIVGDGPMRAELEAQAAGDPRIAFTGCCPYGDELAAHYAGADILAQPSPNETFNLTVLEGLAAGLPVVAIRQGGPLDLVTPEVGELAAPSDPADFARRLERVAERQIPRETCRRFVEETFSWERTFDRLMGVYERSLAHTSLTG